MTEREEAQAELRAAGVLDALRWAQVSAHTRAMQDFDPSTGDDQTVLGVRNFKLMCDRQDRLFSSGRFALSTPESEGSGLDVLVDGLSSDDIKSMPTVALGAVVRSDLNQSPGWRCGRWRWLLASFEYGEIDRIPWPRKSATKRQVASLSHPDQFMLFEDNKVNLGDAFATISDLAGEKAEDEAVTLILAHSLDRHNGLSELYLGRSSLNPRGAPAWYWKINLSNPGTPGGGVRPGPRQPVAPDPNSNVPDAPVRLRPESSEGSRKRATGQP